MNFKMDKFFYWFRVTLVLLVERSLWILMVAGEPTEVVLFLAKTIQRWIDQLRTQPVGWPSLSWKLGSVAVFWFRYGLLWILLFSEGLLSFSASHWMHSIQEAVLMMSWGWRTEDLDMLGSRPL